VRFRLSHRRSSPQRALRAPGHESVPLGHGSAIACAASNNHADVCGDSRNVHGVGIDRILSPRPGLSPASRVIRESPLRYDAGDERNGIQCDIHDGCAKLGLICGNLLAGALFLPAGLPLIDRMQIYQRVNAATPLDMIGMSLLAALAADGPARGSVPGSAHSIDPRTLRASARRPAGSRSQGWCWPRSSWCCSSSGCARGVLTSPYRALQNRYDSAIKPLPLGR